MTSNVQVDSTLIIGITGFVLLFVQIWFNRRQQRLDATFKIIELFQNSEYNVARFTLKSTLDRIGFPNPDFTKLSDEERSRIRSIATTFGTAGVLLENGRIDSDILFQTFGSSIVVNYNRLESYRQWRAVTKKSDENSLWYYFGRLAERAQRYNRFLVAIAASLVGASDLTVAPTPARP